MADEVQSVQSGSSNDKESGRRISNAASSSSSEARSASQAGILSEKKKSDLSKEESSCCKTDCSCLSRDSQEGGLVNQKSKEESGSFSKNTWQSVEDYRASLDGKQAARDASEGGPKGPQPNNNKNNNTNNKNNNTNTNNNTNNTNNNINNRNNQNLQMMQSMAQMMQSMTQVMGTMTQMMQQIINRNQNNNMNNNTTNTNNTNNTNNNTGSPAGDVGAPPNGAGVAPFDGTTPSAGGGAGAAPNGDDIGAPPNGGATPNGGTTPNGETTPNGGTVNPQQQMMQMMTQMMGMMTQMMSTMMQMMQQFIGGNNNNNNNNNNNINTNNNTNTNNNNRPSSWGNLFNSWRQGQTGNCASISVIKAAMKKYGDKVFDNVEKTQDGGFKAKLKDGKEVTISGNEFETAKRMSQFKGSGSELEYAQMCYAVMAKNALAERHEGATTYSRACHSLNDGDMPDYTAKLLGLKNNMKQIPVSELGRAEAAFAWSSIHAVYVDNGKTDAHGRETSYNGTDTVGQRLRYAYVFV